MLYASAAQLVEQYGLSEISQLISDEESLVSEQMLSDAIANNSLSGYTTDEQAAIARAMQRINQVLTMQSTFMDSRLTTRYTIPLPFTQDQVNASPLLECCLALVRAGLSDDDDNMTDHVRDDRDFWRAWLKDVATDKASIPGLITTGNPTGVPQRRFVGQARTHVRWRDFYDDSFHRRFV